VPLAIDALRLEPASDTVSAPFRAGRFNCLATVMVVGAPFARATAELLERIAERPVERAASMRLTASAIRGGLVLRLAGAGMEDVGREIHHRLRFVTGWLQDDPWARKW
jgi:urease accessory protein UreH